MADPATALMLAEAATQDELCQWKKGMLLLVGLRDTSAKMAVETGVDGNSGCRCCMGGRT